MVEHRWTIESRVRERHTPLGHVDRWAQVRYVCSCGFATRWHGIDKRARTERDHHALHGQLSAEP